MAIRLSKLVDMEATAEKITDLQHEAGLTARELSRLLGFTTPQSIYRWRTGQNVPSLDNLIIMSELFGVKIDDMLVRKKNWKEERRKYYEVDERL